MAVRCSFYLIFLFGSGLVGQSLAENVILQSHNGGMLATDDCPNYISDRYQSYQFIIIHNW